MAGAKSKLREYFEQHVGEVIDGPVLQEVSGVSEWGRRIRELKSEDGMNIATSNDRDSLKPGQYLLLDLEIQPAFSRTISKKVRAHVLARNGFLCTSCGIGATEPHPDDNGRKARLHIGHILDKSQGGDDKPSNLTALCSLCNEGASNLTLDPPSWLKAWALVKKANHKDQLTVLEKLVLKFPAQAKKFVDGA